MTNLRNKIFKHSETFNDQILEWYVYRTFVKIKYGRENRWIGIIKCLYDEKRMEE